jgi:heptosyltransferase I
MEIQLSAMKILIIKTSSLGDIIQALYVLRGLGGHTVDWVVEEKFLSLIVAQPHIRKAIGVDRKKLLVSLKRIREEKYDVVFDLQGNCKSALFTWAARAPVKVGFGWKTVREWPNALATNRHCNPNPTENIRLQYLELVESCIPKREKREERFPKSGVDKIMVCPGSKWENKRLSVETWIAFLKRIAGASFCFVWGDEKEKAICHAIQKEVGGQVLASKLSLPAWQDKMREMDLVMGVDSSALHLAEMNGVATFSVFGPSSPDVFKPLGEEHGMFWGRCPYRQSFVKTCPKLRTCKTGACMKEVRGEALYEAFCAFRAKG